MPSVSASYQPVTTGTPPEYVIGDDAHVVTVGGPPLATVFSRLLENAELVTDLDCDWHALINLGDFIPVPPPLIGSDDPRLSDPRQMLDGSVTDESVADNAGIQQHKLNLNGLIPSNYLLDPNGPVTTGAPIDPLEEVVVQIGQTTEAVTTGGVPDQAVTTGGTPDDPVDTVVVTYDVVTPGGITQRAAERVFVPPEQVLGDDGDIVITGYFYPPLHDYAAKGDLVQLNSQKGLANGYCPLDATGRMPAGFYTAIGPGGTINYLGLSLPAEFVVSPGFMNNGAGTFAALWQAAPAASWFGASVPGQPQFYTDPFPVVLIPDLDASKITSGVFSVNRLPIAEMGQGQGIVPDPGAAGDPTDYLARDMTYKTMGPEPNYEPAVPNPSITFAYWSGTQAAITVTDSLNGVSLFYRINFTGTFIPVPAGTFLVDSGVTVEAYAAKIGYQNSQIVTLSIPAHTP
jgi:hypothetical protein